MDSQALIFDVSSDEDIRLDNFDWISKLLEPDDDITFPYDVNNCQNPPFGVIDHNCGGINEMKNTKGEDDDDVIVVGEVIAKPRAVKSLDSTVDGAAAADDDDFVVLEFDPSKPPEKIAVVSANDDGNIFKGGDDDEDDLVLVSEKGQVACRDFPHSRHLCVNLPFSSTPHESSCDLCHCYVCDSVAPCAYWGSEALSTDHCNATDKTEYWQLERKRFSQLKNPSLATTKLAASLPELSSQHLPAPLNVLPRVSAGCGVSSQYSATNIIRQCRSQKEAVYVARNGYQPHLVSRQLLRTCNSNHRSTRVVNSAPRMVSACPVFKRPGYSIRPGVANTSACSSPNNISVSHLQPCSHQLAGNPREISSAYPRGSSSRLTTDSAVRQLNTSCVSPGTLPLPLPRDGLPSLQMCASRFQGCGQSAASISAQLHTCSSVDQTQSLCSPINLCTTSSAPNIQPKTPVTQNFTGPDIDSVVSDMLTGDARISDQPSTIAHTYISPSEPGSDVFSSNVVTLGSCQQPSAEVTFVGGTVPMHEHSLPVEQDPQSSVDYDIDQWLQDFEPESRFLGMSDSQPSATASMDPGMLYFETSWIG